MKKYLLLIIICLCSGCVGSYYGYSKTEWLSFDEVKRQQAMKKYKQLLSSKDELIRGNTADEATDEFIDRAVKKVKEK